jgi:hypothetical protein
VPSSRGTILSLLVVPAGREASPEFWQLLQSLLVLTANQEEAARPVTRSSLLVKWPPTGLDLEARSRRKPGRPLWFYRLDAAARTLVSSVLFRFGLSLGRFSADVYQNEVVENSDFRKYDDTLRMTLDCTEPLAERIAALLADAANRGIAFYGLHRQSDALVTCITPTLYGKHFHFIDGAAGGYATAALNLKG